MERAASNTTNVTDRRNHPRFDVCLPLRVDAVARENRLAVTRDASAQGVLVGTPSRFHVGETLKLTFRGPDATSDPRVVRGEVIRVWPNDGSQNQIWRYLAAIRFEKEQPDFEHAFLESTTASLSA